MRKPASWKVELVENLSKELESSPVTALVSIKGIRNNQLQKIRTDLRGKARIQVVRRRLLIKALERVKKENFQKLSQLASGQIAVVTTEESPNKLYKTLESKKQKAAARGGEIADHDIIIPEMATNFPPGPMISEFQKAGLQTAIDKGKIVIKKETLYVKKGEPIPKEKAKILEKLEILPVTVGLEIIGAFSDGVLFDRDALTINEDLVASQVSTAFQAAKRIALESMFLVDEIVPDLIVRARLHAEKLALEAGFVDESNIQLFILKAIREAAALNSAVSGETAGTVKQEEKTEEKTETKESDEEKASEGLSALFG
ncbi:MAG TPA: 50S ribosomal protein L10 [Thermoplasmataceae archaeon]|nr:50S ribosomal protein L10 [Thermoplasmataceae archaeon]